MENLTPAISCPLCTGIDVQLFHTDRTKRSQREYWRCGRCSLVFVPSAFFLTPDAEKAEYELHENALADDGYRQFLNRFWQPFSALLKKKSELLEFGCGPGPLLSRMMAKDGHQVACFDPFFANDATVLIEGKYDGVTATEVFEHLHEPKRVFEACLSYLKPTGGLGIMTKLVKSRDAFAQWHYKNDLTHVIFFSEDTFEWLANHYRLHWQMVAADVAVFSFRDETKVSDID